MKNIIKILTLVLLAATTHGCATMDKGARKIQVEYYQVQGQYYLNRGDFAAGRAAFAPRLVQFPDDPELNYFMARFELGADKPEIGRAHV